MVNAWPEIVNAHFSKCGQRRKLLARYFSLEAIKIFATILAVLVMLMVVAFNATRESAASVAHKGPSMALANALLSK